VTPVLISSEPWDAVWRRNQQLASRIRGTLFVEPPLAGVKGRWRSEDGIDVLRPAKTLPRRWHLGRRLDGRMSARALRPHLKGSQAVAWVTHPMGSALAESLDAPIVYDRTDDWPAMEQSPAAQRLIARLDSRLMRTADAVVVVSEAMRRQVGGAASLVPNGVDSRAFDVRAEPPPTSARLRIAFAGTVDPFRIDMRVLEELAAHPRVQLVIAGPGAMVPGAESEGVVAHRQLPALFATCHALVAPYRLDCAANATSDSLKLYEYFATGLPVIATPTAGYERYPDIVEYWPLGSSLEEAVQRQFGHSRARREVARAADWSNRAAAMSDVIESVST